MSKFYEIKDLISLKNYSDKYQVGLRKIYRYIGDSLIEHYMIDGIAFLPDKEILLLKESHTKNQLTNSVQILTAKTISVQILTESKGNSIQHINNEDVNCVKTLTESDNNSVKFLTISKNELELISKHDDTLRSSELKMKYDLIKKYLG